MLIVEIKVKLKDDKNSDLHIHLPLSIAKHLKLKEHIPFLKTTHKNFLQSLLFSLKEEAKGLLIEVDVQEANVKIEVKEHAA